MSEKDVFRFLKQAIRAQGLSPMRFLDVGCATGDLLAFLGNNYPDAQLAGIDVDARLIDVARRRTELSKAQLRVADGLTARLGKFDVVTSFGTLGIFDAFEPLLENLVANTSPGGHVYVQALLNPDDIDVRIAYRDNLNGLDWMRGFNIFSRAQVSRWAASRGLKTRFSDFRMTSFLAKRELLPHRAYSLDLADGTRRTTNGLCLLLPETLMELHVPT
ncbi:MAG: class I SAM-dependent methyltransferase [Methyloversatilis sp.]|uniref:class I SAM-dependent methyltransferase n=1 Tax=Methyloversatilis sp. TaxID=2569862 RepID=UPI0027351528|nr:class I SAM-dependent methyltransferase [Methyloversatilis sp.]MDP3871361.1 class I SAM-dependent methyltransferase [Methyloversatilis sp.]